MTYCFFLLNNIFISISWMLFSKNIDIIDMDYSFSFIVTIKKNICRIVPYIKLGRNSEINGYRFLTYSCLEVFQYLKYLRIFSKTKQLKLKVFNMEKCA